MAVTLIEIAFTATIFLTVGIMLGLTQFIFIFIDIGLSFALHRQRKEFIREPSFRSPREFSSRSTSSSSPSTRSIVNLKVEAEATNDALDGEAGSNIESVAQPEEGAQERNEV